MSFLLNPRVLITLAVLALLGFTHWKAYQHGQHIVKAEWDSSVAAANAQAREVENSRHERVAVAARGAASRAVRNRADSAGAGDALERMRHALATRDLAEESAAAAAQRANTAEQLLVESGRAYQELAGSADRHANDVQTLIDAWPK